MEEWKDIPEYEGIYQASTCGRIRTAEGKTTCNARGDVRRWKSRVLKGRGKSSSGYRVSLWKDGNEKDFLVARLIALTFLGNPKDGDTVNHKDGNRFNNSVENLEWMSLADNIRHGFENGLYSTQKPVCICDGEGFVSFKSMSECDRFLGRAVGYTSDSIIKGRALKSADGKQYRLKS